MPPSVLPATHTTSVETRYIPQPAADPAKVRLEMKPADFVVAAGEQQVVVKGLPGETAPLQNGQLGFAVESRAKIDVTKKPPVSGDNGRLAMLSGGLPLAHWYTPQ